MTAEPIKLWAIGGSADEIMSIEPKEETDTEMLLEDALVKRPDMLLPDLSLVGRQASTDAGYPDLLGIDRSGRLVVFELKRGVLTREAIAQVLDYGSSLNALSNDDLADLIAGQSGGEGIENFESRDAFEEWYSEHKADSLDNLRPLRMVLVGLGADERASRIVKFLQCGLDISLLTFHGFSHEGATVLARQVEAGEPAERRRHVYDTRNTRNYEELSRSLANRAKDLGLADLWRKAIDALNTQDDMYPKRSGLTFRSLKPLTVPDLVGYRTVRASHSVNLDPSARIRVTFFPAAIHLCLDDFKAAENTVPFKRETPPNAPVTERVQEQRYCLLDADQWEAHGAALTRLARDVARTWANELNKGAASG